VFLPLYLLEVHHVSLTELGLHASIPWIGGIFGNIFGGYFGGAFSPVVAGMIVDITGSYSLAFISGGVIAGGAALCYWFIVKHPIEE
jgi:hypothetical protein